MTTINPSIKLPGQEYVSPNTSTLVKFPIPNADSHIITNIFLESPRCTSSDSDTESHLVCYDTYASEYSNTNASSCSSGCQVFETSLISSANKSDNSHFSRI